MNIESFNSNTHLTYEELVEYNQGNLSNSEMHRLEQHLIGCELCNEALEGVSLLGHADAGPSIERIKKDTGAEGTSGLGMYHYLGIAATVLLIAVLGFVFTRSGDEPQLLADEVMDQGPAETTKSDPAPPQQYAQVDSLNEITMDTTRVALAENEPESPEQVTIQPTPNEETADSNLLAVEPSTEDEVTQGAVVAELAIAVDSASIKSSAQDSLLVAQNEIARDEDREIAAKSRMAAPSQSKAAEEAAVANDEPGGEYVAAEPERGMRAYQRYLKRNLVYPVEAKENSIEGEVVLNITINVDGSVGQIDVRTSLGYGCDEEAIRLVREGRTWQAASQNGLAVPDQVTLTVSFEL